MLPIASSLKASENPLAQSFSTSSEVMSQPRMKLSTPVSLSNSTSSATFLSPNVASPALFVGGIALDGATFDDVRLDSRSTGGPIPALDNVTFQNIETLTQPQLRVNHPGAASQIAFSNVNFLSQPTTGLYVVIGDTDGVAPVLDILIQSTTPGDGSAFSATENGALLTWGGGGQ